MQKYYYLWILGCQMNQADGERIAGVLAKLGYQAADHEDLADVIVTVACSVRQSAIDRIYGKAQRWQKLKKQKQLTTVLSGCLLPVDRQKMSKIFDFIFDISQLSRLPDFLQNQKFSLADRDYWTMPLKRSNDFQAYVPVSTGCNNYCTYCVVPYTRGREKSRTSAEIINECQNLINQGYQEITLLGQNVNSYGQDLPNDLTFPELLQAVAGLARKVWIRFITSHPKNMSDRLIQVIASQENICHNIHLPVQSGDNEILKRMNRQYTREHYLELIAKIRRAVPRAAISTDIIVGFPGETKKLFQQTAKLMKQAKFDMAYIAQYSPRAGTAANRLEDDVSKNDKKKREQKLTNILKKTALKNNKKYLEQTTAVLVEKQKDGFLFGKTKTGKDVKIAGGQNLIGQIITVKIKRVQSFSLEGFIVE